MMLFYCLGFSFMTEKSEERKPKATEETSLAFNFLEQRSLFNEYNKVIDMYIKDSV